ncbi:MAG TPA: DNA gyrase C-terminal beta-propeller domain-containing protein, partial [Stellaceae bacterium]|nr:DNA gyrase C-terminal beta-propeller domain-containing protein [Stellaceae bacterium]
VLMSLRDIIVAFVDFREEVVTRRTTYLLRQARARAHTLLGLAVAVANIDAMIELIRKAPDPAAARAAMMARTWPAEDVLALIAMIEEAGRGGAGPDGTYRLSDEQAKAILDLRLQRLTALERDKIAEELDGIVNEIKGYLEILGSRQRLMEVIRQELREAKEQFATPRRTTIEELEFETDVEALIQREDMVVTVSHAGYIKRVPLSTYRAQRRGGRGRAGMAVRDEDFLNQIFVASTHAPVLFFTSSGRVYKMKVYRLPVGTPQARGKAMVNLLPNLAPGETISTVMPLPEEESTWGDKFAVFATAKGNVRRNALSDFANVFATGKIAMKFEGEDADDRLIAVAVCGEKDDVLLATRNGRSIRFPVSDKDEKGNERGIRVFSSRNSTGVRGIRLGAGDAVISMSILRHEDVPTAQRYAFLRLDAERRRAEPEDAEPGGEEGETEGVATQISEEQYADLAARQEFVLVLTEKGYGKRSSAYDYPITGRGAQGRENNDPAKRQGATVAVFPVKHGDQIMLVTNLGQLIRVPVDDISIRRRRSGGVTVFKVDEGERVVSVARLPDAGEEVGNGNGNGNGHGAGETGADDEGEG